MIKAVLFDLGNTLFYEETPESVTKDVMPEIELPNYLTVYRMLGLRFDNICETSLDAVAYYYVSKKNNGRIDFSEVRKVRNKLIEVLAGHLKPLDGAREIVREIRKKGVKIAIVSNASSQEAVELALKRHNFIDMIDAVVTSRLVGVRKPDPRIFLYALDLIEVKPSDAIFVGDREYEDICGAKSVGMRAIHLIRENVKPSSCADAYINSIDEIVKILSLES